MKSAVLSVLAVTATAQQLMGAPFMGAATGLAQPFNFGLNWAQPTWNTARAAVATAPVANVVANTYSAARPPAPIYSVRSAAAAAAPVVAATNVAAPALNYGFNTGLNAFPYGYNTLGYNNFGYNNFGYNALRTNFTAAPLATNWNYGLNTAARVAAPLYGAAAPLAAAPLATGLNTFGYNTLGYNNFGYNALRTNFTAAPFATNWNYGLNTAAPLAAPLYSRATTVAAAAPLATNWNYGLNTAARVAAPLYSAAAPLSAAPLATNWNFGLNGLNTAARVAAPLYGAVSTGLPLNWNAGVSTGLPLNWNAAGSIIQG